MSNKSSSSGTGRKLPEAKSLVPRSRKSISTVGGDNLIAVSVYSTFQRSIHQLCRTTYAVRYDMRVAVKRSLWVTIRGLVAGQVPDDQRLVTRTGEEHIGVFKRGREGCNPAAVALKGALENELFRHVEGSFGRCSIDLRRLEEDIQISPKSNVGFLSAFAYLTLLVEL